jgi:RND family efflux transporter MFP subunit
MTERDGGAPKGVGGTQAPVALRAPGAVVVALLCGAMGVSAPWSARAADGPSFDCMIQPRQHLELRSPIEGLIERVYVDRGDLVKKGQVLAVLDTGVDRVAADMAKHRAQMQGAVRSGQSRLEFTDKKARRAQELQKSNYVSIELRDEAAAERQLAEAELQDALDSRRLAEYEYQRQMEIIRLKTIRSPVNGVITEKLLNPGELAEAGVGRKPMLKVAEIEVLNVEVIMPAKWYGKVTQGMQAVVEPEIPVGKQLKAAVTVIDRVLDSASGTFIVRARLPNPNNVQPAGVRCRATFVGLK